MRLHYNRWERPAVMATATLALVVACLGACASASALPAQGRVFKQAFAVEGEPSQVAVDAASGDVYVVDASAEQVERYVPHGSGYELASSFKVDTPGAIAVDNSDDPEDPSAGDVYVAGSEERGEEAEERDYLYKFTASGERLSRRELFKAREDKEPIELELEDIVGVAVDPTGTVWVYWEGEGHIDALTDAKRNVWLPGSELLPEVEEKLEQCPAAGAFAVAGAGEAFYLGYERYGAEEECPGEEGAPATDLVAKVDAHGNLLTREVDRGSTSGVAIEPSDGEVLLDNGDGVSAFAASGGLIQTFGTEDEGELTGARGVAVDRADGEVFVTEPAAKRVVVFQRDGERGAPVVDGVSATVLSADSTELRAEIDPDGAAGEYHFEYCPEGATSSCTSTPAGALPAAFGDEAVSAVVDGLAPATAYEFRVSASNALGSSERAGSPDEFTTLPSASVMPDGRAWELVTPAAKHGAALELPRENRAGLIQAAAEGDAIAWLATGPVIEEPQGNRSFEPTQLISSRSASGWQTENLETPHNRGAGLHNPSPTEYDFFSSNLALSLLAPPEPGESFEDPPLSGAASEKTLYLRDDPSRAPAPSEEAGYEAARAGSGYLAPGYLPLVTAENDTAGTHFGEDLEFLGATPDLTHAVLNSTVGLGGSPSAPGLYEWTQGGALELVSVLPGETAAAREPWLGAGEGHEQSVGLNARNAISEDGSRVLFTEGREHLYLHDSERHETIMVSAAQGHAATASGEGGQEVPEPGAERQEVHFQTASSDGSRVLFTDTARLTEDSQLEPIGEEGPADLYEFELTSSPGQPLAGRLVDLTAGTVQDAADVLGLIPGASRDGQVVYFVANGVLAAGATQGDCPRIAEEAAAEGAACNLYVSEPDPQHAGQRETSFIARISAQDALDWGDGASSGVAMHEDLSSLTSRVSPDGGYLAFMSDESLTGYDNKDAVSGSADEEVYLYERASGRLVCASCNPRESETSGFTQPHGVFDTEASGEGLGLLIDSPELWRERWLAGSVPGYEFNISATSTRPYSLQQPRYLSDQGRLFFDSADALVPQDTNGREDVYEYEPQSVGSCTSSSGCVGLISSGTSDRESAFLDASETGNDVFFMTAAKLVSADEDEAFDIYDAHVCSATSPCLSSSASNPANCESTSACRPGTPPVATGTAPASATFNGPVSVAPQQQVESNKTVVKPKSKPLTRKQKLTKALRSCRRAHPHAKRKRARCEAQARKRYAAKKKSHKPATHRKAAGK